MRFLRHRLLTIIISGRENARCTGNASPAGDSELHEIDCELAEEAFVQGKAVG
jgi:hypothetical protein